MRVTATVGKVLRVFLDDVTAPRYGFELMQRTGLASGTLYPILTRLEAAGWLTGHFEDVKMVGFCWVVEFGGHAIEIG
ncbi:MAG: hypothetical protein ACRDTD_20720, partial [Pseudonocardiaceae bacterium]